METLKRVLGYWYLKVKCSNITKQYSKFITWFAEISINIVIKFERNGNTSSKENLGIQKLCFFKFFISGTQISGPSEIDGLLVLSGKADKRLTDLLIISKLISSSELALEK